MHNSLCTKIMKVAKHIFKRLKIFVYLTWTVSKITQALPVTVGVVAGTPLLDGFSLHSMACCLLLTDP